MSERTLPLLTPLPFESLYSQCARQHRLWGFSTAASTCNVLFGAPRKGMHHDLPNALGYFEKQTAGAFGDAASMARDRTLLGFYAPFLEPYELQAAVDRMLGPSVAHLKFRLGLLTSGLRANHPLKACEDCMAANVQDFGWSYWHLIHQYPGVWVCPWHGSPLRESRLKANGVERFMWHLPASDHLLPVGAVTSSAEEHRHRLSRLIAQLVQVQRPAGWLAMEASRRAVRIKLIERGWISRNGSLRGREAAQSFRDHLQRMASLPDLDHKKLDNKAAQDWISRLARPMRTGTHPLRWLLAIDWLFDDAHEFMEGYDGFSMSESSQSSNVTTPGGLGHPQPARQTEKVAVAERLRAGHSARSVASEFGIDVGTAMAWGAEAGVPPSRRPKTLRSETRIALVCALQAGESKSQASSAFGVSVQSITRLLRTEPGLRSAWQAASARRLRLEHRGVWTGVLLQHPGLGQKLHRSMCPATYAWLYRNDREWLDAHVQAATTQGPKRPAVRWDERDQNLADGVRAAVREMLNAGHSPRIKLWEIVQALPDLRAKMASLHRLPLTKHELEVAIGRAIRRRSPDLFDE